MLITVPVLMILFFISSVWAQETRWEQEWKQILAAAKNEGKVVVMGGADPDIRVELPVKFQARFGITLEYLGGRGSENTAKLKMERRAGHTAVDVVFASLNSLGPLHLEKFFDPLRPVLILPEVVDPSKWKKGKLWFLDPEESTILRLYNYVSTAGISVNTAHIKPEEFKSIQELVNPKWRGKISLFDPTVRWGDPLRFYRLLGKEFVKKLYVDQKPALSRDLRQLADWLGRGIYPISLAVDAAAIVDMKKLGLPVDMLTVPDAPEGISGGNGVMALMNQAPHPNAARVFVNWIASKEGLELLGRARKTPTTRADIDESYALPWEIPQPGVNYFDAHSWETVQESDKWRARIKELLRRGTWE